MKSKPPSDAALPWLRRYMGDTWKPWTLADWARVLRLWGLIK